MSVSHHHVRGRGRARLLACALAALWTAACGSTTSSSAVCSGDDECPAGQTCRQDRCTACAELGCTSDQLCALGRCWSHDCEREPCAAGQVCVDGRCTAPTCIDVACPAGEVCAAGRCFPLDCAALDCREGELCADGTCTANPCVGVSCPPGEVCARGRCYPADCAGFGCEARQVCEEGRCAEASCVQVPCAATERCAEGRCWPIACQGGSCGADQVCVDGRCVHTRCVGTACPPGQRCAHGACWPADCAGAACADTEVCGPAGCIDALCVGVLCEPGTRCVAGECELCAEGVESACGDGIDSDCDSRADCLDPDCAGQPCGEPSLVCAQLACVPPSCSDHVRNGPETDVDCGGGCPGCPAGLGCAQDADCASRRCLDQRCSSAGCDDLAQNGAETDVDCGGPACDPCGSGASCGLERDCASKLCVAASCAAPRCDDGVANGEESDADCGGTACPPCPPGSICGDAWDCSSRVCTSERCATPRCDDWVLNGNESDVDCGGGSCPVCQPGLHCRAAADCSSGVCDVDVCVDRSCTDGVRNGGETDTDCGGECRACADGQRCAGNADCASGYCSAAACIALDPLQIAPAAVTLAVGNAEQFSATGGLAPYTFSASPGTIDALGGLYTAPSVSGGATVRVTDALGRTADAAVTVNPALTLLPATKTLTVGEQFRFSASGGVAPYQYVVSSGGGTIDRNTGAYLAPAGPGQDVVKVSDSRRNESTSQVTVVQALRVTPAALDLVVGEKFTFSGSGGVAPYAWSVTGSGTIDPVAGLYTAPSTAGGATVRLTDALGATTSADVTVAASLRISPAAATVPVGGTVAFSASGGIGAPAWSLVSGGGTIDPAGVYHAPSGVGSARVRVSDTRAHYDEATVTVVDGLVAVPSSVTLAVGDSQTFTASGGQAPYTWSVASGVGTINASTGAYSAGATAGSATVKVADALGQTATSSVTVNAALQISPTTKTLATGAGFTFSATGGVTPYTWSVLPAGTGTINASSGAYVAPSSAGSATVRVTDARSHTSDCAVTIASGLTVTPASAALAVGDSQSFTVSGGQSPYTWSVLSGVGTINATSGVYSAGSAAGSATVRVSDTLGQTATAPVTVNAALQISPTTKALARGASFTFSATGGVTPYTWSVLPAGTGTINASSGAYVAPSSAGSATVRVTDARSHTSDCAVTIASGLTVTPASATLAVGDSQSFAVSGGQSPYTWSVLSGVGTINATSGAYSAGSTAGSATVKVADSLGQTATASVTVNAALQVSPTTKALATGAGFTFSATGGVTPYTFSVLPSGMGTINSTTGAYVAPSTAGTATVRVTDARSHTSDATVTVASGLTVTPASATLAVGDSQSFTVSGGQSPYTWSVLSGVGTINATSGAYSAGSTAGSATVKVADALGQTGTASVTVHAALQISPTTKALTMGASFTFSATGGVTPYAFSVLPSGMGTINSTTGAYVAPSTAGTATVRVTDARSHTSDATVAIASGVQVTPPSVNVVANAQVTFSASGGSAPYTWSVTSGGGSIGSASGVYTAPATPGPAVVQVADLLGQTATAAVSVIARVQISPTTKTLASGASFTFTGTGGVTPYTWSVLPAGMGTINSSTGAYTAPSTTGTATVRVTDLWGYTSDCAVTIVAGVVINPTSVTLMITNTFSFAASGGVGPYTFTKPSGIGSVTAAGLYTAPTTNGTAVVRVTDSAGATADASVTVNGVLRVTPPVRTMPPGSTYTFAAFDGAPPYIWSTVSGGGSITQSGVYTAPATPASVVLRVTDSRNNTADATVTVSATATTVDFQDGVLPTSAYAGTRDATLQQAAPTTNAGTGDVRVDGEVDTAGNDDYGVFRWDVSQIPAGSVITGASLTMRSTDYTTLVYPAYELKRSWVENQVTWNQAATGQAWGAAGASAATDRGSSSVAAWSAMGYGRYTSVLTPAGVALVQSWVDTPATNNGLIMASSTNTSGMSVASREYATAAERPKLTVVYEPALAITPTSASVPASTTKQFSATGGVPPYSWSVVAGGVGTVSGTGLYTAPATAGTATVRVTDSGGRTKDASVTVTSTGPSWWNTSLRKRQQLRVTNPSGAPSTPTNLQASWTVDLEALGLAAPYSDLRIARYSGGTWTMLDHDVDRLASGMERVWFKLPVAIAGGSYDTSYWAYYGVNTGDPQYPPPAVTAANVWELHESFDGAFSTSKWVFTDETTPSQTTPVYQNGELVLASSGQEVLRSVQTFGANRAVDLKWRKNDTLIWFWFGFQNAVHDVPWLIFLCNDDAAYSRNVRASYGVTWNSTTTLPITPRATPGTGLIYSVERLPGSIRYFEETTSKGAYTGTVTTTALSVKLLNGSGSALYFDWVRVRQVADQPPAVAPEGTAQNYP